MSFMEFSHLQLCIYLLLQQQVFNTEVRLADDIPSLTEKKKNNKNSARTESDSDVRMVSVTASFALPAGSYATVFLREVMNNDDFM